MKQYYKIAGLTVLMDSFGKTEEQARPYLITETENADVVIVSRREAFKFRHPEATDDLAEYLSTGSSFYRQLINFGGIMLHSSAVVVDGYAYLFTAPCGTGKSTHTSLWLKKIGDKAFILNDDKPAIRFEDNEFFVYGTPWSGKTSQNVNCRAKLGGICILNRGDTNVIERVTGKTAIQGIFSQTLRPKSTEYLDKVFYIIEKLIATAPIWKLSCNMETEAADVSYNAMSGALQNNEV